MAQNRAMKFGYLYDLRNPAQWQRPWVELYAQTLEFITWTESIGFEGAWIPEHHGAEDGYIPSPNVMLAAIAARTKTIKLGAAIALAPLYHPVRFAEECAILDILSNGRLETALAVGYRRRETAAYGVDFSTRGRRMDEFLQIVRRLWAGETFSFQGKHFTLGNASITPKPIHGQLPLFIGGFTDKALERAAKYGDGYFGNEDVCERYLQQVRAFGHDPAAVSIRIQGLFVVVAHDPDKAMQELAPYFHYVNNAYGQWLNEDKGSTGFGEEVALKPMSLEQFKTSGTLRILTPGEAIDMFKRMLSRTPVEHFMMMAPPGLPLSRLAEYAQVFAQEVIPAFR
jgi:alkanesulfonate monooxygenase SsuD/methylene tetrahydromethanopterin reductase-like flavin-dependent oxidoreductase (luciferase family)